MPEEDAPDAADTSLTPPPRPPAASRLALFLDFDGTLVGFADRPDGVEVVSALPPLLHEIAQALDGALALVSGRPLAAIDRFLGLPHLAAAGSHGAELRTAGGRMVAEPAPDPRLPALLAQAQAAARSLPGVLVEAKRDGLALHWRQAPAQGDAATRLAGMLAAEAGAGYRLQPGSRVVELRRGGTDKGQALLRLMAAAPFAGREPWMIGDDLTDEDAFRAAIACGGQAVIVGRRRPTAAGHALPDPAAVHAWLASLLALARSAHA